MFIRFLIILLLFNFLILKVNSEENFENYRNKIDRSNISINEKNLLKRDLSILEYQLNSISKELNNYNKEIISLKTQVNNLNKEISEYKELNIKKTNYILIFVLFISLCLLFVLRLFLK